MTLKYFFCAYNIFKSEMSHITRKKGKRQAWATFVKRFCWGKLIGVRKHREKERFKSSPHFQIKERKLQGPIKSIRGKNNSRLGESVKCKIHNIYYIPAFNQCSLRCQFINITLVTYRGQYLLQLSRFHSS